MTPCVRFAPTPPPDGLLAAVRDGGGTIVDWAEEADLIVWQAATDPTGLAELLEAAPNAAVQLPWAGVEPFLPLI